MSSLFDNIKPLTTGQERLLNLEGQAREDFDYLLKNGAVDKMVKPCPLGRGCTTTWVSWR